MKDTLRGAFAQHPRRLKPYGFFVRVMWGLITVGATLPGWASIPGEPPHEYSSVNADARLTRESSMFLLPAVPSDDGFLRAAASAQLPVVRRLVSEGANVNAQSPNGWTPLILAAQRNRPDVLNLLINHPETKVNESSSAGMTALKAAAQSGHLAATQVLLRHPAIDVNTQDAQGRTPLAWAALNGHELVVRILAHHKEIQLNLPDSEGWSPLMLAAREGHSEIVETLLTRPGLALNLRDPKGETALIAATAHNRIGVVKLLVAQPGLDIRVADENGLSAKEWAQHKGYVHLVEILDQAEKTSGSANCQSLLL